MGIAVALLVTTSAITKAESRGQSGNGDSDHMPHSRKIYGHLTAPVQFERWCVLYLEEAMQRHIQQLNIPHRMWARNTTHHIMSRFQVNSWPKIEE